MARYDTAHKEKTRAAILEQASRAFRARGIAAVGIHEVMNSLGLTHGGFYAHFRSKDDLVGQACAHGLRQGAERRDARKVDGASRPNLARYIASYLAPSHRDRPETGCPLPALTAELGRGSEGARHELTEAAQAYVDGIRELLPDDIDPDRAWALLAGMAGSVMLARAVDDPVLSDQILRASKDLYLEAFGIVEATDGEQVRS